MNYSNILKIEKAIPSPAINILLILMASWVIGVSAQLSFTLPFSPVPITGQTIIVLLAGVLLGKNRGAATVGLYLVQGAAGLPVFASGKSGLAVLVGPTGGYLFGFLAAAYVVGCLTELRFERSIPYTIISLLIGNTIIYAFGLIWLVRFVGESQVLNVGLYPFILGDLVKITLGVVGIGGSKMILRLVNHQD
jgi:biotin transport system substrate-specific component